MFVETVGPTHEATAWTRYFLSRLWCESDRPSQGEPVLAEALRTFESSSAVDPLRLSEVRLAMAKCLIELGERNRARDVLLEARRSLLVDANAGHPPIREVEELLARLQ
jgi:hypothetical protein